jgi:hypothetical protein
MSIRVVIKDLIPPIIGRRFFRPEESELAALIQAVIGRVVHHYDAAMEERGLSKAGRSEVARRAMIALEKEVSGPAKKSVSKPPAKPV